MHNHLRILNKESKEEEQKEARKVYKSKEKPDPIHKTNKKSLEVEFLRLKLNKN